MSATQEQEWVPCWCGKPAAYTEFDAHGSPPTMLCMEHKPQYAVKMIRESVYGPRKVIDIAICQHCYLSIRLVFDKDSKLRAAPGFWIHTQTGQTLCRSTEAEPAVPA